MAASKSYFPRANYRFLPSDQNLSNDSMIFELDESDVWNSTARSQSPEFQKANSRISRKASATASARGGVGGPASLPVNVPDWSKILKQEYRESRRRESDEDYDEDNAEENGNRIPPHEFLAARNRISSFSVHEGIGRTLKGRDLSRVRNAIWQKTGFED
ncbi:hypothetical protein CDL12_12312 [Handroanthus impetiginosus]|uniref:Senescence regulator S40 n=1 Tax=Handroanthus impetiginosus TaxID=429701 RepID=A0A2G9HC03_9LAMI|nr:hypothetical protein CDL12_12312 [Handroanthus impetiginosus]